MRVRIAILVVLVVALGLIVSLILRTREPAAPVAAPGQAEGLSSPVQPGGVPAPAAPADKPSPSPGDASSPSPGPGAVTDPSASPSADPQPAGNQPRTPGARPPGPDPRVGRTADGRTILKQPFDLSRQLHAPGNGAREDVDILDQIFWYYRKVYGENPVVESERAVIDALTGQNPKQIVLFDPEHPGIGEDGELLDRFGNPYYFHSISADTMDIVSPGPDGTRGTPDDIHLLQDAPAVD